ncbi:hypothetical protein CWC46_13555 [Prodigiosinella confusarubida]|uniref:Serine hydroxymethyltransferase-like domain-containing protein n=1 Tax=Serratia sp. (strain ATCC 39006) TaxID=104623 RepID=A0A2I5TKH5_SERS3|nr:glycine hydroxymethyltransferase [Serratia sp. ATCC 39006]AUH00738.1 hypothetical protein CWC46_13555 [Serratia sp. ATCC 39006]AUH05059.1 hypothetical protein Ser39006_013560 [Serratia sp. ATCC 39006]
MFLSTSSSSTVDNYIDRVVELFSFARRRRKTTISLTANENILSDTARLLGQNRYYDRYYFDGELNSGCRYASYYNGMQFENFPEVSELKEAAMVAAQKLFSASFIEFRVLSGVHCTLAMIASLTEPGDTVWALDPRCGGHFATGPLIERLGRKYQYLLLKDNSKFDEHALALLLTNPPSAIVIDHGLANNIVSVSHIRQWLVRQGLERVLIIYDASHLLGLIAGKTVPNPLDEGADILQGNTHKSFPGPHRAIIAARCPLLARRISEGLETGMVSSPNLSSLLQLFVTLLEMDQYGESYAQQMCSNAQFLAQSLTDIPGWEVLPTSTHKILLMGEKSSDMAAYFNELGLRVNNKSLYGRSCLRLGVQEITRLGINNEQLSIVSGVLRQILLEEAGTTATKHQIEVLGQQLQHVHYSFDSRD